MSSEEVYNAIPILAIPKGVTIPPKVGFAIDFLPIEKANKFWKITKKIHKEEAGFTVDYDLLCACHGHKDLTSEEIDFMHKVLGITKTERVRGVFNRFISSVKCMVTNAERKDDEVPSSRVSFLEK